MNKKLGKVAAIALSAAMISSAFAMSTASSFAATTKFVPSLKVTNTVDVAAVSSTSADTALDLTGLGKIKVTTTVGAETKDNTVSLADLKNASSNAVTYTSSNTGLIALSNDNKSISVKGNVSGTATVTATVKQVTINTTAGVSGAALETEHVSGQTAKQDSATQDVTATFTVHVYKTGATLIAPSVTPTAGDYENGSYEINYNTPGAYKEYNVTAAANNALATYAPKAATLSRDGTQKDSFVSSSDTVAATSATETVTFNSAPTTGQTVTLTLAQTGHDNVSAPYTVSASEDTAAKAATALAAAVNTAGNVGTATAANGVVTITAPASGADYSYTVGGTATSSFTTNSTAGTNATGGTTTVSLKDGYKPDGGSVSTTAGQSVTLVAADGTKATVKTNKTYKAAGALTVTPASGYGVANDPKAVNGDDLKDVTIDLNGHTLNVNDGAVIGNVIDTASTTGDLVTVTNGTVGTISNNAGVTVENNDGTVKIGDVTTATAGAVAVTGGDAAVTLGKISAGTVSVTGDTSKNNDGVYSSVETGDIAAAFTTLRATQNDDKSAQGTVKVGNIATTGAVKVTAPDDAQNLTVGAISGKVGQTANCPFKGSFELASGTFKTGDLKNIGGVKIDAGKLTVGAINTGVLNSDVSASSTTCDSYDGSAAVDGVEVAGGELTASSIYTAKLKGTAGKIIVPAGSLEIAASVPGNADATGTTLQISNLQANSVLYKTMRDKTALFKTVIGVSNIHAATASDGKTIYSAQDVQFAGIKLDKDTLDIGKDDTAKLSVVSESGAPLPTGVTVKWAADKDTVQLTPSADGLSCDVKSIGYTADNVNSGNDVKVTATLQKDGVDYTLVDDYNYTSAVTLTAEAPAVLSTKVNGQAVAADTVVKVTQSTAVPVSFSSNKTMADFKYSTGNAKVAETGTKTAWNGTAGEYTVYTNGAVGSQAGVFVNGKKVFIVEITGRPFKCDTTYDISMKAGKKYSFKITPAKDAPIADFTFNTANDAALSTWGFTKNADGTVTATLKANEVGKYGVFVNINGQQYKVFAVSVAK